MFEAAERSILNTRQGDRLKLAVDAAGVALWAWNVDTDHFEMDERS